MMTILPNNNLHIQAGGCLLGECRVPGDKSISHRALMLASIANGISYINNFLPSGDCIATMKILESLGVHIEQKSPQSLLINGMGRARLHEPMEVLDCGNSGTAMRLLLGLLAGQGIVAKLTGDGSLSRRPMARVIKPLLAMGADISAQPSGTAPLSINSKKPLKAIVYDMPLASAQLKSCIMLAALSARGRTEIIEPAPSRDHTEKMLQSFGYPIEINGKKISLTGGYSLKATDIEVPGDISSAAFFMVGATIAKNSILTLMDVGINPTRTGVIEILKAMGANIHLKNQRIYGHEPVADIHINSAILKGIEIPRNLIPLAIDEFPILFIAAACAKGKTVLRGAEELRVKETDRLAAMATGLQQLGIKIELFNDGISIEGGQLTGGQVDSYGDHRIAMAFAIAGLCAQSKITISNCHNIITSFPNFLTLAQQLGLQIA